MSGATFASIIITLILLAIIVAIAAYLLHWLYRRSSKEVAFVRTGFGGQRVVLNGGAFVLPIIHDITPVNMSTLKLEVRRARESALITRNRMRVDVVAEFYMRVQTAVDAIATAAQTLGRRTLQPEALRELMEGKFVDALRAVAAEMTMEEMHEKRGEYVKRVRASVAEDLMKNGLELESVSLTSLDQTNMEFFNPSNAFDAEGLTRLTEEIERRKKIRNDIEQDTLIQIRNKNLEAEKIALEIERDSEYARLEQSRELDIRRAAQQAEIARERAIREREAEQARVQAREELEKTRITVELALDEERIHREREVQRLEIERRQALEIAEQERAIAIAERSKAQSQAQAEAEVARAKAVEAEEKVFTAREAEVAQRRKQIELIGAAQEAEREALRLRVAAEAEKAAALDRADARRIAAEGEADADKIRALVAKLRYEIDADGTRQMNEAQNVLTPESRASNARLRLIDKLDVIIRESVKPLEKIEGIKILQVDGLAGGGAHRNDGQSGANFADNLVNSALRYRAQAPLVDSLLKEIGLSGGDINKMVDVLGEIESPSGAVASPKAVGRLTE
ncbi:MAG: flotillin domain-containing protein [Gammaproteobacteria bacterium]